MKGKINVAELLRNCPKGMELDCYLFNGLEFDHIDTDDENYPIVCRAKDSKGEYYTHTFTKYGWYTSHYDYAKCVIFPKGKTTWEGFHRPFKEGDIIHIRDEYSDATFTYVAILKQIEKGGQIYSHCFYNYEAAEFSTDDYLFDVYSIRFATEEEKQKLFQAIKDNGYKWNPKTKTLEELPKFKVGDRITLKNCNDGKPIYKITKVKNDCYETDQGELPFYYEDSWMLVPNKFDITTLVPFESRVLVRNSNSGFWQPTFWGIYEVGKANEHQYRNYLTTKGFFRHCIPYNDDTKHLLGTTDDCDEYFKTWE